MIDVAGYKPATSIFLLKIAQFRCNLLFGIWFYLWLRRSRSVFSVAKFFRGEFLEFSAARGDVSYILRFISLFPLAENNNIQSLDRFRSLFRVIRGHRMDVPIDSR